MCYLIYKFIFDMLSYLMYKIIDIIYNQNLDSLKGNI